MDKLELIKEFDKYHPGYGVEWGYSEYVGGMTDTGRWLFEVLASEPVESLQSKLDFLKEEHKKSQEQIRLAKEKYEMVRQLSEKEQRIYYKELKRRNDEEFKKIFRNMEMHLMWGKK